MRDTLSVRAFEEEQALYRVNPHPEVRPGKSLPPNAGTVRAMQLYSQASQDAGGQGQGRAKGQGQSSLPAITAAGSAGVSSSSSLTPAGAGPLEWRVHVCVCLCVCPCLCVCARVCVGGVGWGGVIYS